MSLTPLKRGKKRNTNKWLRVHCLLISGAQQETRACARSWLSMIKQGSAPKMKQSCNYLTNAFCIGAAEQAQYNLQNFIKSVCLTKHGIECSAAGLKSYVFLWGCSQPASVCNIRCIDYVSYYCLLTQYGVINIRIENTFNGCFVQQEKRRWKADFFLKGQ